MKKKIFITLFLIYATQFISSCCKDAETFEVTYSDISVTNFKIVDTLLAPLPSGDIVDKTSFALSVYLEEDFNKIGSNFIDISDLSFQKSYAAISCPEDNFVILEEITAITIFQIESNNRLDVTSNFQYQEAINQFISVADFVNKIESWQNGFELYLRNETNIESNVQFEVVVDLSTNRSLTFTTEAIRFN